VTLFGGDQANHVPAIFAGPGITSGRVEEKLVRSFDLTPTWASWLGIEPPASWQGVDLSTEVPDLVALLETSYLLYRQPIPDLLPGEIARSFPRWDDATFIDERFDWNFVLRDRFTDDLLETKCFAVRRGSWKLVYVPGENGPIFRLFDLAEDPECRRDRARERPDVFDGMKSLLPPEARWTGRTGRP
jgi:arylsulfatase A-like enzyme